MWQNFLEIGKPSPEDIFITPPITAGEDLISHMSSWIKR
jgi:hypothetical protein